jgi:hypothetical protein
MPSKPRSRAPSRERCIVVERRNTRVSFWWRGARRGIGLPFWQVFRREGNSVVLVLKKEGEMIVPDSSKLPKHAAKHGPWRDDMPHLATWICDSVYPDGQDIGPTQLQCKREGSIIRATLKIADQGGLKVSALGEDCCEALLALDLLLGSPACPWERDPYPLAPGKGKKK